MLFPASPTFIALIRSLQHDLIDAQRQLDADPSLIRLRDACGNTALHLFSQRGDAEIVSYLRRRGALIDSSNDVGSTPLIDAAKCGHAAVCSLLLDAGADQTHRELSGDTALAGAALTGRIEVVQLLLTRLNGSHIDDLFDDFNVVAVRGLGRHPIVDLLDAHGLRQNACEGSDDRTGDLLLTV